MKPQFPVNAGDPRWPALQLAPRAFIRPLVMIITALSLLSILVHVLRFTTDGGVIRWYYILFDQNREANIPSYYQGATLMLSAIMLAICARATRAAGRPDVFAWKLLAFIFVLLSIDEICSIHELVGYFIRKSHHYHGLLYFSWVIPGSAFALTVGLCYIRFLMHLPRRVAIWFVISGAIYVGGAVGMESVGGLYSERFGEDNLTYQLLGDCEETMEMVGIGFFIITLLHYIAENSPILTLQIGEASPAASDRKGKLTLDSISTPARAA